jgi:hypothetical protein
VTRVVSSNKSTYSANEISSTSARFVVAVHQLPSCNEKSGIRISALRPASITSVSREIHSQTFVSSAINRFAERGNDAGFAFGLKWGSLMIKTIIGAAAIAAVTLAVVPAQAAKVAAGCSSDNLAKTEASVEAMADGDGKWAAEKEMAAAQDALLNGKWGACGMHLSKAAHAGMAK